MSASIEPIKEREGHTLELGVRSHSHDSHSRYLSEPPVKS